MTLLHAPVHRRAFLTRSSQLAAVVGSACTLGAGQALAQAPVALKKTMAIYPSRSAAS